MSLFHYDNIYINYRFNVSSFTLLFVVLVKDLRMKIGLLSSPHIKFLFLRYFWMNLFTD